MAKLVDSSEKIKASETRNFLIYGETGTRKTTSLQTLPPPALPALLLDVDEKSHMLREIFPPNMFHIASFDRYRSSASGKKIPNLYTDVRLFMESLAKQMETFPKTIILDSATLFYDGIMDEVYFKSGKDINSPPSWDEYHIALTMFKTFLTTCLAASVNFIMICHEKDMYDEDRKKRLKGVPALTGQLGLLTPRYFSEVLHATTERKGKEIFYIWHTVPVNDFIASCTISKKGESIPQDFSLFWEENDDDEDDENLTNANTKKEEKK